jgi:hypothetical protein
MGVSGDQYQARACIGKGAGDGQPDPARRAGDERGTRA